MKLRDAIREGDIEAVQQHLAAGAEVNAKDEEGLTPLHIAASWGHKEVAELLIDNGADVNAKENEGRTPLDFIIKNTEIADLLHKHGGKHSTINAAAAGGDAEGVKEFLAAGADVNARDDEEGTPLHNAVGGGHKDIVELLIKLLITKGADVNTRGFFGMTPLHAAAMEGNKEIAELLIAAGANVNAKNDDGRTPLHQAARNGHKEIAELLIAKDKSAWRLAWPSRSLEAEAKYGSFKGADVNAKDEIGWTPLHWAANNGYKEVVELLMAKGAGVNAQDGDGTTPLEWGDDKETAAILRKHGGKTGEELKAECE